jgi:hypothetical protein
LPLPEVHQPTELTDDLGCFVFMAIFAAFGVIVALATELFWLIVPVVAIALALAIVIGNQKLDIQAGIRELTYENQAGLLVYSDSPLWKSHIETEWLPRLGSRMAILNWSERRNWDRSDPYVRLFNGCFGGDHENYNPVAVLLRKDRRPLIFRFYPPFKHAKFGRREELELMERKMFKMVEAAELGPE